jgi:pyridoxamine 5'-phosphate oxidase
MVNMELFETRKKLILKTLDVETVNENPITQLEQWLNEASLAKCPEYSVMTLATASLEGQPSTRVVLLKYLKKDGLYFFTNYDSRKGKDLLLNPNVAANFFWPELERQVRIEGQVTKADPDISDFYFRSRPFESKVSAIISPQRRDITDR